MRQTPLRIALLGRCAPADSPAVAAALALLPGDAQVERVPVESDEWPQRAAQADVCIVFQSWPDEIASGTAHRVVAACLAARLICCAGAWCASAGRTRGVWPQAVCVPVEDLSARIRFELAVLTGECAALPATASRAETFSAVYGPSPRMTAAAVIVDSPDAAYAAALCAAFSAGPDAPGATAVVVDVDPWDSVAANRLAAAAGAHPQQPVVAVAGFPRADQFAEFAAAGATATIARLSPLTELQSSIAQDVGRRRNHT